MPGLRLIIRQKCTRHSHVHRSGTIARPCRQIVRRAEAKAQTWQFGFQCNERYLEWDASAQARLLKLHVAEKLGWSTEEVSNELQKLVAILPDLTVRLDRMKADLLMKLLTRQDRLANNLLALRRILPAVDAASLVLRYPALMVDVTADVIEAQTNLLREKLPEIESIDTLVEAEPRLLQADVDSLLGEVRRLLPDRNPQTFLAENPTRVMDMSSQGLRPSLEDEPGLEHLPFHSRG